MTSIDIYSLPLYYVYKITNKETGEFYIGSRGANVKQNYTPEQDLLIHYFTSSVKLKRTIKANPTQYVGEILYRSNDNVDYNGIILYAAYVYEQILIREYIKHPLCVNQYYIDPDKDTKAFSTLGTQSHRKGKPLPPQHTAKLKQPKSAEAKEKYKRAQTGATRSEETKAKIRKALTGRPCSEEKKAKIRATVLRKQLATTTN